MSQVNYVKCSPGYEEEANHINNILLLLERSKRRGLNSDAVIYVGHVQYHALRALGLGDPMEMRDDKFQGLPVVVVMRDNYCRIA